VADPGLDAAVHKAVHDALLGESGLTEIIGGQVYDRVPPAATAPYASIDSIEVHDDATTCSDASEVHVTVKVWSGGSLQNKGSIEAKKMGGFVRRALGRELQFEGHVTAVGSFDVAVYRPAENDLMTEGVLTFTYLVDPA
jgi:hypothetical protein